MRCPTEQKDMNHARRFQKAARIQTVEKTFQSKDYGKEDSVKDDARRLIQRATDAERRHLARGNPSGVSFAFNQPVFQTF